MSHGPARQPEGWVFTASDTRQQQLKCDLANIHQLREPLYLVVLASELHVQRVVSGKIHKGPCTSQSQKYRAWACARPRWTQRPRILEAIVMIVVIFSVAAALYVGTMLFPRSRARRTGCVGHSSPPRQPTAVCCQNTFATGPMVTTTSWLFAVAVTPLSETDARRTYSPAVSSESPSNVAMPSTAETVFVPESEPPPGPLCTAKVISALPSPRRCRLCLKF